MTPPPELVSATPFHAAAFAAIHQAAFPPPERWDEASFARLLAGPGAFGWLHPAGGLILARLAADEAEILTLAVAPPARRRGLARALLNRSMRAAGEAAASSMVLEVGASNAAARALYAAAGFRPVGRRRAYYAAGEDALILRAPLTPPA